MRQLIKARLDSHEWWVLVSGPSQDQSGLIRRLEATHYAGEAGTDFETLLIPDTRLGLVAVFLARKLRCLPSEMQAVLQRHSGAPLPGSTVDLSKRDLFIISDDRRTAAALTKWLAELIGETNLEAN
jgi:hypothetical protein